MEIYIAQGEADLHRCFAVAVQLRPHLSEAEFVQRVKLQQSQGYQLALAQVEGAVVAIAGFRYLHTLIHGPTLYVDDLVTDAACRSQGYGQQLLTWLRQQAQAQGCCSLQLDSGVQRADAHRFYFREGLVITSFRFVQRLGPL